ncbi:DNA/RNA nuclease SfsA [Thalassotalea ganghwensis]
MSLTLSLEKATLIKRYKRFLADVTLTNHQQTTIHCANTGAMTGCAQPGDTIWYSTSTNTKRKYPYSWELTQTTQNHFICVNTHRANQLVENALVTQQLPPFKGHQALEREVKYGQENSKIDFKLIDKQGQETYIEVKSVTLLTQNQGYFPDAVTTRGQKHLRELIEMKQHGHRACLLFAVMHSGIDSVRPAKHIDPAYSELLSLAYQQGVELYAYQCSFNEIKDGFSLNIDKALEVILPTNSRLEGR